MRQLCDEVEAETAKGGATASSIERSPSIQSGHDPGAAYRAFACQNGELHPGIPLLMPGEWIGHADGPVLAYLLVCAALDFGFRGFADDIHGDARDEHGAFSVRCLDEPAGPR